MLKTAIDAAANEKVMIAGTAVESAIGTLRLTEYAYDIGYDVAMVRTPHYYKGQMANPQNMLAFYRFVCDRSPLPVIIYNFPQATSYDIPAELVIELAEHPNLIGIKESSGSIEKVQKMVEATRHIQRKATVTETFTAVTGRMFKAAELRPTLMAEHWFPSEASRRSKSRTPKPSSSAVKVVGWTEDPQKRSRLPGAGRRSANSSRHRLTLVRSAPSWPLPTAHPQPAMRSTPPGKRATRSWRKRNRTASPRLRFASWANSASRA